MIKNSSSTEPRSVSQLQEPRLSQAEIAHRRDRTDADMEDYGFEYSDEEQEEQDVDIENQYYNSKGLVETDPEGALSGFAEGI
ncbi:hypothetical protein Ahy_B02g061086 isoform D [Arachis hypogaea]|uniref:Uncharacterized protein n=1 Tax=Arachis hypogaea TaxID=3818 RepID=A0A445AK75_ARAHY|nr:hypothetical protein Ahy_B02g061086 isoform D [Arachis hypogaea]